MKKQEEDNINQCYKTGEISAIDRCFVQIINYFEIIYINLVLFFYISKIDCPFVHMSSERGNILSCGTDSDEIWPDYYKLYLE